MGIIEKAVRFGIIKHVLLDDAGFSMGAALWNPELAREVENLEEDFNLSDAHGASINDTNEELIDHTSKVEIMSNAVRVEICKKILFEAADDTLESLPLSKEMSQKSKILIDILACKKAL